MSDMHELKTDPAAFQAAWDHAKTFEIRFDDRGFKVGDLLILKETTHSGAEMKAGAPLKFTGRVLERVVSHIQSGYGLGDGWVCLSFDIHPRARSAMETLKLLRFTWEGAELWKPPIERPPQWLKPVPALSAAKKDALLDASIGFIGTLTGMTPPPIETAPPEVFAPFRKFVENVEGIILAKDSG